MLIETLGEMKLLITKEICRGKRAKGIKVNGVMQGKKYRERERERDMKKLFTQFKMKFVRRAGKKL